MQGRHIHISPLFFFDGGFRTSKVFVLASIAFSKSFIHKCSLLSISLFNLQLLGPTSSEPSSLVSLQRSQRSARPRSVRIARHVLDDSRWIAGHDLVRLYILDKRSANPFAPPLKKPPTHLRNHTPRPNHHASPQPHARQNNNIPPDPTILPNMHLLAQLRALRPAPHVRVQRVRATVDADVGRDERPRADCH